MRKWYRIAAVAACVMGLLVWLTDTTYPSAFQRGMLESGMYSIAALVVMLSVVAVPVLFVLTALEGRRLKRQVWPDVLLLAVTAGVVAFLWFPALISLAGV